MPPKQKPKKGGLTDKKIETTVQVVKQYWPNYEISVENIRNPSREFVIKLYTECVNNLDAKCAFVTKTDFAPYPQGLGEEELLFLKLSKIPLLVNADCSDFKLGDLFAFDPKRVNGHILLIMHFLVSTENLVDKMLQICNRVFDSKEKMYNDEEELKQLKEEKTQKQISLTLAKTENKKLKERANAIAPKYEETLALIDESEKKCKDSILEAEKLRSELEIHQEEVEKHEKTKQYLQTQIVTEEEYSNLKSTLESLKKEEENLEEIDLSNDLYEQKQHLERLQMCLQELNHLNLPEDLLKLSDLRMQVKNEQQNLQYDTAIQQNDRDEIQQLKTQLETQKRVLQTDNGKLQEALKKAIEDIMTEEIELKKKYQQQVKINTNTIEDLESTLKQAEINYQWMKAQLTEKYTSICEVQDITLERFRIFLSNIKCN